ncbi:hypothetical protein PR202_ga06740 [Eleusine coracana subsp. coracana]|uniref:Uncharacterized protein n=1 Tax=Eleusine coracana subsp. coracana TaxID=191504 RepID=A0AAV5BZ53_ELECO|nr:hypothetical protein PR202_ga06740 [Eleusine coracana subsp. coracana]
MDNDRPPGTKKPKSALRSFASVFAHADAADAVLMVLGMVGAIGAGVSTPVVFLISSFLFNAVGTGPDGEPQQFRSVMNENARNLLFQAIASWFMAFLGERALYTELLKNACSAAVAIRADHFAAPETCRGVLLDADGGAAGFRECRPRYLKAVLRQDVEYFDIKTGLTSEAITSITNDSLLVQDMLSEKLPNFVENVTMFVAGFTVGFVLLWRLTLVALPSALLLLIPGFLYGRMLIDLTRQIREQYNRPGAMAQQAVSSVRTVYSFVAERSTTAKFSAALEESVRLGLKQGLAKGVAIGSNSIRFAIYAFTIWYGSRLVMYHGYKGGTVYAASASIVLGGTAFGSALSNVKYFSEASSAAEGILEVIQRVPKIDSQSDTGEELANVVGEMEFKNVEFCYPSRPESPIFTSFNLRVPAGRTVALVGSSGSGKSTVIALLERFYDPSAGEITLDGVDIRRLRLKWLRAQMGLVSQEPALFALSIKENILFGKEDATEEEIVAAAKAANAHNFISQLPQGYDTQVGELGVQISGGQKQRIAIARAILKSPKILLLDEATSALDTNSERVVQQTLDLASVGRTTFVIAHRLSTIQNADMIAVMQSGEVKELGSHDDLIANGNGLYSSLARLQKNRDSGEANDISGIGSTSASAVRLSNSLTISRRFSEASRSCLAQSMEDAQHKNAQKSKPPVPSFRRLLMLNAPEWKQALMGSISAVVSGAIQPVYSYVMGTMITILFSTDHEEIKDKIRTYALFFVAVTVRSLVGDRLSLVIQTVSAALIACIMGLVIAWRLALVMIAAQPLVIICFYARRVLLKSMSKKAIKAQSECSKLAAEAVSNLRTITAFSSQDHILHLFNQAQHGPRKDSIRQSWFAGLGLGTTMSLLTCTSALDLWYGGMLMAEHQITAKALFQTFMILISTGRMIADAGSMTTDLAKGADAVASVFAVLDRQTKIDSDNPEGFKPDRLKGEVDITGIDFAYPSRPDVIIFQEFSLKIQSGKSTAIVGQSGSGKSTIVGLIERFYDPLKGVVEIDNTDIRTYNLRALRRQIGLVSQEPTLLAATIRENIVYGSETASEEEIENAARSAFAHDFISGLKDGYDTWCGERGVQLSGGQKQRIAVARAIVKNPAILLLDEATSALDSQSEKEVQEALDRVMVGRTSIVVAHRLSTIQNCDLITVLDKGTVVEKGTHASLMAKGPSGTYFGLVSLQQGGS